MKSFTLLIFCVFALGLMALPAGAATYYVDQNNPNSSDTNAGTSTSAPWKNCPGMGGLRGTGILQAGDKVFFDRGDVWLVSGEYGLHVKGGVSYIGDEWGTGTKATIRLSGNLTTSIIDVREDHATIPTIVKGFEVDGKGFYGNGVGINHPRWTGAVSGATKRFQNLHVHHTWSSLSDPSEGNRYFYGMIFRATAGSQGAVENVEVLNCLVHHTSRDGIALYPDEGSSTTMLKNVLVRGNEIYATAQDPVYADHANSWGGLGIVAKGHNQNATIEYNFVHDTNAAGIVVAGNQNNHYGVGATNIHIRYNILTNNGTGGIRLATGGGDPKDVKIYGNISYNNQYLGGMRMDTDLSGRIKVLVYNNTFYNSPIEINCPNATFEIFEFKNNLMYYPAGTALAGSNRFTSSSNNFTGNPPFKNTATAALPTGFSGTFGVNLAPNPDGLSLLPGPSAIDKGVALAAEFNSSVNSLQRPQGSAWDIGAYEAGTAQPPPPAPKAPSGLRVL